MVFCFGVYELDEDRRELRRGGEINHLEPQVFFVLAHLIRHRDRVVTRIELLDEVWGSRYVGESALTSRIKTARQAVGDSGREQAVIRTVHGRGSASWLLFRNSSCGEVPSGHGWLPSRRPWLGGPPSWRALKPPWAPSWMGCAARCS